MSGFNPDFWEVTISHDSWSRFSSEQGLYYVDPDETEQLRKKIEHARKIMPLVRPIMDQLLTPRQRQVIELYFFAELNQRQIAQRLGVSQQTVNEHLNGKVRNGRNIGGALRKLKKECLLRGIRW